MFSQPCVEVPVSLSDVGSLAVEALVNGSFSVVRFVLVFNVSKYRSVVIGLWATRIL